MKKNFLMTRKFQKITIQIMTIMKLAMIQAAKGEKKIFFNKKIVGPPKTSLNPKVFRAMMNL